MERIDIFIIVEVIGNEIVGCVDMHAQQTLRFPCVKKFRFDKNWNV